MDLLESHHSGRSFFSLKYVLPIPRESRDGTIVEDVKNNEIKNVMES